MNSYDFLNLSFVEFETLIKDLLEEKMAVDFESFAEGTDYGIDLRYQQSAKKEIIVQCKRNRKISDLRTVIKQELKNVLALKPHRYILATSVDLTPSQKAEIKKVFAPYIRTTGDILGKKEINGLIRKHPHVEQSHFKLWISSTNVLNAVLKSKVINQSQFEIERIRELLKLYVYNPSFTAAQEILKERRFVIISGIPGIGKTTLARILSFSYLSKHGYKQFVYLSNSIDEGYDLYKPGIKQVFLYDDFLGQSFEDRKLDRNEDKRLIEFIKQIEKSHDKILLFTTREYILKDAQDNHELLNDPDIDLSKCIIDLSVYTKKIKSEIFYNHLFFSDLSPEQLKDFTNPANYNRVINHISYSPRIIKLAVQQAENAGKKSGSFLVDLLYSLDKPFGIWEKPYSTQINTYSQCLLPILLTAGSPMLLKDLKTAMDEFCRVFGPKYQVVNNDINFRKSLKELDDSFIKINKDADNNKLVQFQNPSVQDFLLTYFDQNRELFYNVLLSATFYNQLFRVVSNKIDSVLNEFMGVRQINSDQTIEDIQVRKVLTEFDHLSHSSIVSFKLKEGAKWRYIKESKYTKLRVLYNEFSGHGRFPELSDLIVSKVQESIDGGIEGMAYGVMSDFLYLVDKYKSRLNFSRQEFVNQVMPNLNEFQTIKYNFKKLKSLFPVQVSDYLDRDDSHISEIMEVLTSKIKRADDSEVEELKDVIYDFQRDSSIDCSELVQELEEWKYDKNNDGDDEDFYQPESGKDDIEDKEIESLFRSLLNKK